MDIHAGGEHLAEHLVLLAAHPVVHEEGLAVAELDGLALELAALHRAQDVTEGGALLLAVPLTAVLGRVLGERAQLREQRLVLERRQVRVRVALRQLAQQRQRLARRDPQVHVRRLEQVHQVRQVPM